MNTLPLQQWVIAFRWEHNGNLRDKKISKPEAARDNLNGEIIRIGRDKQSCNLYLEEISVSSQHAEIYFNEQQQKFFIKSLKPNIILQVDGQDLVYGQELPLKDKSTIVLGLQKIEITDIQIYQLQSTNYSGIVNSTPNSNPVNSSQNLNQVNSTNSNTDAKGKFWQDKVAISGVLGVLVTLFVGLVTAGVTYYNNTQTQKTEILKSNLQTYSTEKLDYIKRLTDHKTNVIKNLQTDENNNLIYRRLILNNDCDKTVYVAASFEAPDGIQQTKGWLRLKKKERNIVPGYYTLKPFIHLYALYQKSQQENSPKSGQKKERLNADEFITWAKEKGFITLINEDGFTRKDVIFPSEFDYIENPLFLNQDEKDVIGKAAFYFIRLTVPQSGEKSTIKTFTCKEGQEGKEDSLELK